VLMICFESIVENSCIVNRQSPSEVVGYRNKLGIENRNTFPCSMIRPPRPSSVAYLPSELAG